MAFINCYSHYFKITNLDNRTRQVVERFIHQHCTKMQVRQVGWSKGRPIMQREPGTRFAVMMPAGDEFRLHINQLQDFLDFAKSDQLTTDFEIVKNPLYSPISCEFIVDKKWEIREAQVPLIEYITTDAVNNLPARQRAAILQTGAGKSLAALFSVAKLGIRTMLSIKSSYAEQWAKVVKGAFSNFKSGDIVIVSGTKQLISLMNLQLTGELTAKFIIITNKTFQLYINDYLTNRHALGMYPIHIDEFYEKMGIGIRFNDEVHMHFHFNYMQDLFSNLPLSVGLTATLTPDDAFMDKMYKIMFPVETRFKGIPYDKYAHAVSLHYRLNNPREARYKQRGMGSYNHIVYEEWLLKNRDRLRRYISLIDTVVNFEYVSKRVPGEKMLVFASSIELCTVLYKHYREKYPNLNVKRYVEDDPFSNVLEGDLCISNLLSSGTAVDIPGLVRVLMTTALGSSQLNEQAFGRLRKIKTDSGLRFIWLTCDDIPQHKKYDEKKIQLLKDKAVTINTYNISIKV